jgi:hypothetical protein
MANNPVDRCRDLEGKVLTKTGLALCKEINRFGKLRIRFRMEGEPLREKRSLSLEKTCPAGMDETLPSRTSANLFPARSDHCLSTSASGLFKDRSRESTILILSSIGSAVASTISSLVPCMVELTPADVL